MSSPKHTTTKALLPYGDGHGDTWSQVTGHLLTATTLHMMDVGYCQ